MPVWSAAVGLVNVVVTGAETPLVVGFNAVTVVNLAGTRTRTVPVWPAAEGVAIVDVTVTEAPLVGFNEVSVVKGVATRTNTVPV